MALTFAEIYRVVRLIPKGRVMSYSGVARQCGYPRSARQVGYAMHGLPENLQDRVPWWRVINAAGRISNQYNATEQCRRLRDEAVLVDATLRIDMRVFDAEFVVYKKLQRPARSSAAKRGDQESPR
jgi:methylated-DNA-protein-cysteine methyltransferase related protein